MTTTTQLVAIVCSVGLLTFVIEAMRRRLLAERYALLWIGLTVALIVLAAWGDALEALADLTGISLPSNAFFAASVIVTFLLLFHFSIVISRQSDRVSMLAQEAARLDQELRELRASKNGHAPDPDERERLHR